MFGIPRAIAGLASLFVLATLVVAVAPSAQAADVSSNLYAASTQWHVGSATSSETAITVHVNDTLRLRIENRDTFAHTFTAPHFPAVSGQGGGGTTLNVTLSAGRVFFWNYTMTTGDQGTIQFYCSVAGHSTGTYPSRTGMVGTIVVQTLSPPSTGGDNTLLIGGVVGVVVIVAIVAAVAMRRKPKPPAQP